MKTVDLNIAALPPRLQAEAERALGAIIESSTPQQQQRLAAALDGSSSAQLGRVLATSPFFAAHGARRPELLLELLDSGDLQRACGADYWPAALTRALAGVDSDEALALALRQLRTREQCRIIWRDFNRLCDWRGTTAELSAMADSCIQVALDFHYRQMCEDLGTPQDAEGRPQQMVVLGMGKLGACELNLSSDVDLIFSFPAGGQTSGGRRTLSNQDFFVRLGQRVIKTLDQVTGEGFVFRVDMRLRPYGQSGALALSFNAMQDYYHTQGRDWERYAMIKARVVAGDREQGARLLELLRPFVYRRYVDFSAIESLRDMKALIKREITRLGKQDDVKLGAGGIREIEFIGQVFQLIRGGREVQLQERRLMPVLDAIRAGGYMPAAAVDELQAAYGFLRDTEHAIQGLRDRQTQALPDDALDRLRIAVVMGYPDWAAFRAALDRHRECVQRHFEALIESPERDNAASEALGQWEDLWLGEREGDSAVDWLGAHGYRRPADCCARLDELRNGKKVKHMPLLARSRLDAFMPLMLSELATTEDPDLLLERLLPLVEAVLRRTAYLVLLMENQVARRQLYTLAAASPWIAEQLARHPVLLDELHNVARLYRVPERDALRNELHEQVSRLAWDDLEGHMEALRYFRLAHVLRIAASEVTGRLPLMKVSDYLTFLAEVILQHMLDLAWQNLVARHGLPFREDGSPCEQDFIIVGYGKLGGIELGHGSDLDLVFIHDADTNRATSGPKPVAGQVFFTRLGQRIIHILTAATTLGPLYEVDMRLRPSGESGLLVASLKAYEHYQFNEAWTWEHQALVRARVVAGSARLGADYEALRCRVLCQSRDRGKLAEDVRAMRARMREHLLPAGGGFDLKQSPGGIVDIEFMVQFMVLAWANEYPSLARWSDNVRILEALAEVGLLATDEAEGLTAAYTSYRACAHRLALQQEQGVVAGDQFAAQRGLVGDVWARLLGGGSGSISPLDGAH